MASKFTKGDEVSATFNVKDEIFTYTGVVIDVNEGNVIVRTNLQGDVQEFFPRRIYMHYNVWVNGGFIHFSRNSRYLQKVVYDDGLDNWV